MPKLSADVHPIKGKPGKFHFHILDGKDIVLTSYKQYSSGSVARRAVRNLVGRIRNGALLFIDPKTKAAAKKKH